jgi:hypothetical protein
MTTFLTVLSEEAGGGGNYNVKMFSAVCRKTIFLTVLSGETGGGNYKVNIFLAVLKDDYIFDSALGGSRWGN